MKLTEYTKEDLIKIIDECESFKELIDKLNQSSSGNAYKRIKMYLDTFDIDYSSLNNKRWCSKEKTINEVFVEKSSFCRKALKTKILKYKLLEYKCVKCQNVGEWSGQILSLHLDHINGDKTDNRLDNLRFLCPNCHSQTPTYAGKNNKMLP